MATVATNLLTAEEFFEWANRPENRDRHYELEQGEIVEVPRPGERHGVVCGNVAWILGNYVRQRRKGMVCSNDSGIIWKRNPDTVRGPDVVLYDDNRRYEDLDPKFTERLPALAVEVCSPSDRAGRILRRVSQFLKWGVPLIWVVDPEDREVTVWRRGKEPYVVGEEDELTGEDVLADFRCRVADLFFTPSA